MPSGPAVAKRQRPSQEAPANSSNNIISRMLNQVAVAYDHGEKFFPLSFNAAPLLKAMGVGGEEFFDFPTEDAAGEHWVSARRKRIFRHLIALMDAVDAARQPAASATADEAVKDEGLVLSKLFLSGFVVFLGSAGWGALVDDDLLVCSVACQYYSDRKLSLLQTATLFHHLADRLADIYVSSLSYLTQCVTCVLKRVHVLNMKVNAAAAPPLLKGESSPSRTASPEQHALTARMTQLLALVVQRIACWPSPLLHSRFSLLALRDVVTSYNAGLKKHWRELKPTEYRLQARLAAEIRQIVGVATPLTWLSLVHLVAYFDVSAFKNFQRGISIASKPPLTEPLLNNTVGRGSGGGGSSGSAPSDVEAPFPPLDRLAIRTRTKYKFTFPTCSAIRESFYWWNILTVSTRLFCQSSTVSSKALSWATAFDPAVTRSVCKSTLHVWQTAIVQGQLDSNFALRHILRVIGACTRDRRDNVYISEKALDGDVPVKPVNTGNINLCAVTLLTLLLDLFGASAVHKEFIKMLKWNRDLMLTKLAFETNALPTLIDCADKTMTEEGVILDDPLVSVIQKKSVGVLPSTLINSSDNAALKNGSFKLNPRIFSPDCIASASGIGICSAILVELGVIDFETVWLNLPPDDYVLELVSRIHRLSLENPKAKAQYIEQVEQCAFARVSELWFKTQLVKYFSDIQKRDSMDVLMHCTCPRLELLAAAVELNLKEVSLEIITRFERMKFPYYLSRIIRKAFGTLIGSTNDMKNSAAILGLSRGHQWVSPLSDARNGVLECYSVMRGWILGNAEVVSIVCEELKKQMAAAKSEHVSPEQAKAALEQVEDLMVNGVMTALLLLPTPSEIPAAPASTSQPIPYARTSDTVSHQVSDIIWDTIQDWSLEQRYRVYARFYFEKMNELEIEYLCKQDRARVNKSSKKITASSSRTWDKVDKSISTAICRSLMNNPFETFSCLIHNAELFDPMWLLTALDYLRVLTRLACDILQFMIIERQQTISYEVSLEQNSCAVPRRVRNLSLFAARFLRKFSWMSHRPLIMSICGGVFAASHKAGGGAALPDTFDHIYLCDLLTWLGGCNQTGMMEMSAAQLNCCFGGPALRAIGLGDESIRKEELKPGARLCKNNLRDVLLESNVFRSLVYGLGKMNINVTYNIDRSESAPVASDDERLTRILETSQSIHSTLAHLLDFVVAPSPLAISTESQPTTLPSRAYRIFPAALWDESFRTLPSTVVWQLIRWASPPCLTKVVEAPQSAMQEDATASEMVWFTRSSAQEVEEFLRFVERKRPRGLSLQGFLSFWLLQAGDLNHPKAEYERFIKSPEALAAQLGSSLAVEDRDKRKLSDYQETLQREDDSKSVSTAAVLQWFAANGESFVAPDEASEAERSVNIVSQLVVPRSSWTVHDALFCFQWLTLMVKAGALDVASTTLALVSLSLPAIFGATDLEADSLGLLCSTWLSSLPELLRSGAPRAALHNGTRLLLNAELVLLETLERVKPTWFTARRILRLLNQVCSTLPISKRGYERVTARIQAIQAALPDNREITSTTKSLQRRLTRRKVSYAQELVFPP